MIDIKLSNIVGTELEESYEVQALIDEIQLLLFTIPGDVLGEPQMGIDLRGFLWETNFSSYECQKYIQYQINRYILWTKMFDVRVQVRLIKGEVTDSAFVDIIINDIPAMGIFVK